MPSGATHDRITLWSAPAVAGAAFSLSGSTALTLLCGTGYLLGGLMFGPDLDIHSRQFLRWGWLRTIWLPYRWAMKHRSILSHGPVIGTVGRILYLLAWVLFPWFWMGVGYAGVVSYLTGANAAIVFFHWVAALVLQMWDFGRYYWRELLATVIGIELGAMSHSASDVAGSAVRRILKGKSGAKMRA